MPIEKRDLSRPVDFGVKRSFWLLRGAGSVVFVLLAILMLSRSDTPGQPGAWLGLAALLFFGTALIVCLVQGFRRGPRLTLDAAGVHDRTLGVGVIAWADIRQAGLYWIANQPFISLRVHDAAKYVERASAVRRLLIRLNGGTGAPQLQLNLAGLDANPAHVLDLMMELRRNATATTAAGGWQGAEADVPDDDDELEETPPSARRVRDRAIVLTALAMRSSMEDERTPPMASRDVGEDAFGAEQLVRQRELLHWLEDIGAGRECEPRERQLLEAEIGSLAPQDAIDASWELEGAVVLAWALGRIELPPFDQACRPAAVADALGLLERPLPGDVSDATLRAGAEIEALERQLFTIHWRLREFSLRREPLDFRAVAARTRFGLDPDALPLVDGDLAIDDTPVSRVPEERWRGVLGIASERHRAVNWLMGHERLYSDVTADT